MVVRCKEIEIGKKYVLTIGNDSQTIEMEAIIYGEGNSFRGKNPGGMHQDGEMPPKPERKEMPKNDMGKEDDL